MDRDLHLPHGVEPSAVAVVLHPHPSMGGDRHHPLVVALAEELAVQGVAALRVDIADPDLTRAVGELEAAAAGLATDLAVDRVLLVGYSWGSVVSSLARPVGLAARVLVAPPVAMLPSPAITDGTPTLVLVPAHDQYGGPEAVTAAMGGWAGTTIEVVEGCDHFLAGAVARISGRAVAWLTAS